MSKNATYAVEFRPRPDKKNPTVILGVTGMIFCENGIRLTCEDGIVFFIPKAHFYVPSDPTWYEEGGIEFIVSEDECYYTREFFDDYPNAIVEDHHFPNWEF